MLIGKPKATAVFPGLVLALIGAGLFVHQLPAQQRRVVAPPHEESKAPPSLAKSPRASKFDLTPASLPRLHALIRPQEREWRHLRVQWLTDPVTAVKKAAQEDKPLVFLHLAGAGYNAPLGVC